MPELNRRRFLQIAGATAGFSALSSSIDRAAAIPASRRSGTIQDVEHIVVLMQENRSFDHYFGALKGVRGFGDPRPVTLPSGKSVWHQSDGSKDVLPYHPDAEDLGMQFIAGLNHDWQGGHKAWNQGKYDQWIPAKSPGTMAYLTREDIPFHYALADRFTVCDAYHCSFIGATDPNRYYMWSGHTGNDGKGGGPVLGNDELGYDWTTYPERLESAGISWKIYQDIGDGLDAGGSWGWIEDAYRGNYGDNSLLYFNKYRNAKPGDPLFNKARTGTDVKNGDGYFDLLKADVKAGKLPQISWIAAPEAFSEHPNWPANYGAWYIAQVLDALTSNPEVWSKTALFITYDENDGYFDHITPPYPPASAAQGLSTADGKLDQFGGNATYAAGPYGLGQRVPMLVVSPWSTGGYVCSEVFDHTSIVRFMERRFGVGETNISPWRRAICGDLTSAFDFGLKDTRPASLPDTDGYEPPDRERHNSYVPKPPVNPVLPKQERGSRPARPLPYAPVVDGAATPSTGRFTLTFSGGGKAGAFFSVTSGNRTDGPWTYTTEAGKTLSDTWNTAYSKGVYDLSVFGPNGFLRTFKGAGTTAGAEVTARHVASSGRVELTMTNTGADCRLTLTNAYGGRSKTFTVRKGARRVHTVDLGCSKRWYDLSVVSSTDGTFLRRFAGHVENGLPGVSDPAIITV
ncbi:phospholipase C, phosphocholine-specific [Streptomyces lunaelactis]|uniref:phosphocholine-specific phospholipase C n=1 Tax=Streptomyces lunaelactis TaxID=1535768 RepID=UPI0015845C72|nr:phospholipase C, phosphocholine-specific [Streptomyces lunaelactis]NUK34488.1 phospholipase C, phosphocholine-specific [Streptomyces lunaelactis]NUK39392.1 phospholipase C, phosphocholine-specific [Streptomyces lunaelactis]NUK72485.1 phospholipase C, phosphocholine-specific [Streptomyces lunaelactis]NUK77429.1 phospholipase C, phosphocholine-specific [Streptomyces lunaelactis]NUK93026.1 phospholipase C, phosphocholine-specific [Streptomyces lunaelactis]